ncbi:MAG: DUF4328 domain-containing protein [Phycisphaerales bacterium]|nr:DUF4328 domain-containing protein [Phycisphaerales bacterium]
MSDTYKPQGGNAALLTFFFALCAIGGLVAAGSSYFQLEMLQMVAAGKELTQQQAVVNDLRQLGVALGQLVLFIVTSVVFCVWVFHSHVNARILGAVEMKSSPGWAVGSFFVPIANLVAPYFAMVELWKASEPSSQPVDATARAHMRLSPLLGAWWLTWLLGGGISSAARMMVNGAADPASMMRATNVEILSSVVWVMCCLFAAFVVRDISWRQSRRHNAIEATGLMGGQASTPVRAQAQDKPRAAAKPQPAPAGVSSDTPTLLRCAPSGPDPETLKPIIPLKKSA